VAFLLPVAWHGVTRAGHSRFFLPSANSLHLLSLFCWRIYYHLCNVLPSLDFGSRRYLRAAFTITFLALPSLLRLRL